MLLHIIKRKFKQWWSTILPISTKHISSQSMSIKQTMTYDVGNRGLGLGQAQQCGGVNWGPSPPPPPV